MAIYEIWREGYLVTGMEGIPAPAALLAKVEAQTFSSACDKLCTPKEWQKYYGNYDSKRLTVWGCRLFDNAADARKAFG